MLKINSKIALAVLLAGCSLFAADTSRYGLGTKVDKSIYAAWDTDVEPSSKDLPEGSGTAQQGAKIFQTQCAMCHGADGQGIKWAKDDSAFPHLIGKPGTLKGKNVSQDIGSYWPYASTLFDYINRAMPLTEPKSLSTNEVYSVVAFLLYRSGVIKENMVVSNKTLNTIKMPNQNGFICDNRPNITGSLCVENCPQPNTKGFDPSIDKEALSKIPPIPATDCYLK